MLLKCDACGEEVACPVRPASSHFTSLREMNTYKSRPFEVLAEPALPRKSLTEDCQDACLRSGS